MALIRDFFDRLVTDEDLATRFDDDAESAVNGFEPALSDEQKDVILHGDLAALRTQMQMEGTGVVVIRGRMF